MSQRDSDLEMARKTADLLTVETSDFNPRMLPNSPGINPANYKVRSAMQQKVYNKRIKDVVELRLLSWQTNRITALSILQSAIDARVFVRVLKEKFWRQTKPVV